MQEATTNQLDLSAEDVSTMTWEELAQELLLADGLEPARATIVDCGCCDGCAACDDPNKDG
jgi:hypothetical protein